MRVSGDYFSGWRSAVIQAAAMHENRLPISKPQRVSQPVGMQGASDGGQFCVDGLLVRPGQGGHVPEGTGTLTCLAAHVGLDSTSRSGSGVGEA